jgi:KDO2-lipid IV(A) lauroyltransferase
VAAERQGRAVHRLEYAGLLALRGLFGRLPPAAALGLGARLGRLVGAAHRDRARVGWINLGFAFPELGESERGRILRASFESLGRGAAEWLQIASGRGARLLAGVELSGLEHLEEARRRSRGGGVIALSAHLGNWELGCAAVARAGLPVTLVFHRFENPWIERRVERWRSGAGIELRELGSAAGSTLRDLAAGRIVVMTLDQNARHREGVFVPFFGRAACTRVAPAGVAARTGAPVVPVFDLRVGDGSRHVVRFNPALELESPPEGRDRAGLGGVLERNTARMTRAIEDAIRKAPEQWIWSHRRWKTRPAGEPRRYPSRRGRSRAKP